MKKKSMLVVIMLFVTISAYAAECCIPNYDCGGGDRVCSKPNPKNCWGNHYILVIGD